MALKGKQVLVTGGTGFIGSHLVDRLIEENPEKIYVLSNFFLGKTSNLSDAISKFKNLEVVKINVADYELVKHFFEKEAERVEEFVEIEEPKIKRALKKEKKFLRRIEKRI